MLTYLTNARLLLIAMHKRADRRDAHPQLRASLGFTMTNANKHGCRRCAGNDPYTIVASDVMQADDAGGPTSRPVSRKTNSDEAARALNATVARQEQRMVGSFTGWVLLAGRSCM